MRTWLVPLVLATVAIPSLGCAATVSSAAVGVDPGQSSAPASERSDDGFTVVAAESLPAAGGCDEVSSFDDDPRCPDAVLHAATLSWLGKVAAEVTEEGVHVYEYDPAELRAEASVDVAYRSLLRECDRDPTDGVLSRSEALEFESRVLKTLSVESP